MVKVPGGSYSVILMRDHVRGGPCALRRNECHQGISRSNTTRNTSRSMPPPPSTPTSQASLVRSSSSFGPSITGESATGMEKP